VEDIKLKYIIFKKGVLLKTNVQILTSYLIDQLTPTNAFVGVS
jgi:hypothetical protein